MVDQHVGAAVDGGSAEHDVVHHPDMEANMVDRRNVLVGGIASIAAVAGSRFLGPVAHGPAPESGEHGESGTVDAHAPEEAEYGETAGISTVNWVSALPVGGMFGREIGMNIRGRREFGAGSWLDMAVVEGGRLAALKLGGDKHQFDHETTDIGISYSLMLALTAAAEATEHGEADEAALFNRNIKRIADGLEVESTRMPEASAGPEAWSAYLDQKKHDVAAAAAQNTALAAIIAPAATTYTSASLVNATTERMAKQVAELKYAERMTQALQQKAESGQQTVVTEDESFALMEQALGDTNEAMNGPGGYVRLALTTSANLQGASLIGDPPNWFYLLKNGPGEWIETSKYGFKAANAYTLAANTAWLKGQVGGDLSSYGDYFKETAVKTGQTIYGMAKSFKLFDQSLRRNQTFANNLQAEMIKVQGNGFDTGPIQEMLREMPRTPFSFYDGFKNAVSGFNPFGTDQPGREERDLARGIHDYREMAGESAEAHFVKMEDLISDSATPVENFERMFEHYGVRQNSSLAEHLSGVLVKVVRGEATEEDRSFLAELNLDEPDEENMAHRTLLSEDLSRTISEIHDLRASKKGMSEADAAEVDSLIAEKMGFIDGLVDEFEEQLPFLPIDMRHAVKFFVAEQIDADAIDRRLQPPGLGHSSKEVFSALATQILAANAVASLAKKMLELADSAGMPFEAQNATVLLLSEALSGVADNVVAYLFAQDVLQEQYKKRYGQDVFEREGGQALKQTINSSALFAAVAGGALTKIGNGPNFKFTQPVADYHEGEIRVRRKQLTLDESKKNYYAWGGGAATMVDSMRRLRGAEQGMSEPEAGEHEEALARQDQRRTTRRQLFTTIIQR